MIPLEPVTFALTRFFLFFTSEVIVYNLDMFLSFFLAGVTMYFLVRHITESRLAAFYGGLAYMALPYHSFHSIYMGGGISSIQWMPLYLFFLLKFMKRADGRIAFLLGVSAVVVFGTSVHYALFMGIMTPVFLVSFALAKKALSPRGLCIEGAGTAINKKTLLYSLVIVLIVVAGVAPFVYLSIFNTQPPGRWGTSPLPPMLRTERIIMMNSAKPAYYMIPSRASLLYRDLPFNFIHRQIGWSSSLFVGWSLLALAGVGMFFACANFKKHLKRKRESNQADGEQKPEEGTYPSESHENRTAIIGAFIICLVVFFLLSMPPRLKVGSLQLYMPSFLFRVLFPWFRWILRTGVVFALCAIVIASYGLSRILRRYPGKARFALFSPVAVVLALELLIVPPFLNTRLDQIPGIFKAVKELPGNPALVFYPLWDGTTFGNSKLLSYQRYFKKPMLNGAHDNSDGEALRRTVINPFNDQTPGILRRFGIEYMVFIEDDFSFDPKLKIKDPRDRLPPQFKLISHHDDGALGRASLYGIEAEPSTVFPIYTGDITTPRLEDFDTVRLVVSEGIIRLVNENSRDVYAELSIPIMNRSFPHDVIIRYRDRKIWSGKLRPGEEILAAIERVTIPPGESDIEIIVEGYIELLSSREAYLFGTEGASLRIGDLRIVH